MVNSEKVTCIDCGAMGDPDEFINWGPGIPTGYRCLACIGRQVDDYLREERANLLSAIKEAQAVLAADRICKVAAYEALMGLSVVAGTATDEEQENVDGLLSDLTDSVDDGPDVNLAL